jgi:Tol biopolymer transport system component
MKRIAITFLLLIIVVVVAGLYLHNTRAYLSQHLVRTAGDSIPPPPLASPTSYLYYTLKDARGFVVARAPKGSSGQPLSSPQIIAPLGNSFGLSAGDSVSSMQLSPDASYLAISGSSDHIDLVWMFNTQRLTTMAMPANVAGNFLNWLPRGNGHSFLYRPMLPLGPNAPLDGNSWNPGLWKVDAATGAHTNIAITTPSADLLDATASPDGSRIVYSTTSGLGTGSKVWLINNNGTNSVHVLTINNGPQSVAGLFSWSPDGAHIAYERLVDSPTPFLAAGVWVMNSKGTAQTHIADADGGHGYPLAWSPDSQKIAYVVRTNLTNRRADALAQDLQSAIGVSSIATAHSWIVASPQQTGVQLNVNPSWTPNSASITFTASNAVNLVTGGSPRYYSALATAPGTRPNVIRLTSPIPHVVAAG